ncbi:MAG: LamG-like jellyroll fold domain-containing protein [Bacteroidia bacterium]|nr:LamG-like jellyroll fold domain-containing protein [Bacteroidia bacterium]
MNRNSTFILIFLFLSSPLFGNSPVSGNMINQVWTKANSPYCVSGDIFVSSLTIEAGVRVIFQGDYLFEVGGILTAVGAPTDSIYFTKSDSISGWRGIQFNFSNPASEMAYCRIDSSTSGGIRVNNSSPTIRNCRIIHNSSTDHGAGVWTNSQLTLNCTEIIGNYSSSRFGGGVYNEGSLRLLNCAVRYNVNEWLRSSVWSAGGGIYSTGSLYAEKSEISYNHNISTNGNPFQSSFSYGGGIYIDADSLELKACELNGNATAAHANTSAEVNDGGALYTLGLNYGKISNSIFGYDSLYWRGVWAGSSAKGGGIYIFSGNLDITNSTIAYNSFDGIFNRTGNVNLRNSIVFFHPTAQIQGTVSTTYSNVQNSFPGTGNIALNPLFFSTDDLRIVPGSPSIDAGDPASQYNDVCSPPSLGNTRNDMGAEGGPTACSWLIDCSNSLKIRAEAGPDQAICEGESVQIGGSPTVSGGTPPYTYSWTPTTNLNAANIPNPAASPGISRRYTVSVTDAAGSIVRDSVWIEVGNPVSVNLGPDVVINPGGSIVLDAKNPGASYAWNTGDTSRTLTVNQAGDYYVTVRSGGCIGSDTISVFMSNNLDSCLVVHYDFNGDANDRGPHGLDGTVFGATLTQDNFGNPNSAYLFDGNDRIDVADDPALTFGTDEFTFTACVRIDAFGPDGGYYLMGHSNGPGTTRKWIFWLGDEGISFIVGPSNGWNWLGDYDFQLNTWYTVAIRRDADSIAAFVDSVHIGSIDASLFVLPNMSTNFQIGTAETGRPNRLFKGAISDLSLYRCALNDLELRELCTQNSTGREAFSPIESLKVYPNPSDANFRIELQLDQIEDIQMRLFDLRGKMIAEQAWHRTLFIEHQIDLSAQTDGVYLLQLQMGNYVIHKKLYLLH